MIVEFYMNKILSKIKKKIEKGDWYRISFLGDSITSTEWVHPNWREIVEYVLKDKLEEMLGSYEVPYWKIRCYNDGFNGASTRELISFVDEEIGKHNSDLIIFLDTYNDKYYDISFDKHRENLQIIFDKLKEKSSELLFSSSISSLTEECNKKDLAYVLSAEELIKETRDIKYIDLFSEYSKFDLNRFFTFISENNPVAGAKEGDIDPSHPNQLGNAYIAKVLLKEIFGIEFDPELYIKETLEGKKYPAY